MSKKVVVLGLDVGWKCIGVVGCDGIGLIVIGIIIIVCSFYD